MFIRLAEIFLRFLIKGFLAAWGTEVVGLPLVLGCASRGRWINIHSTNRVMYCICHINHLLVFNRIIALSRRVQKEQNYSKTHAQYRLLVGREYPINSRSCHPDQVSVEVLPFFADPDVPCWIRRQMRISRSPQVLHPHL